MALEEMKSDMIEHFSELQAIKKDNGGHENQTLDYRIKVLSAKLASLGVNVEDLTL
ncbi:MAG: hypothetical protein IJT96_10045 [Lachnospiraceae bacterium]|nr:hypothetical protein [Lachnospiraceae bacterium]